MDIQTILAIAEKHNNPDAEIQFKTKTVGKWVDYDLEFDEIMKSAETMNYEFRIKPKTVTLNGEELLY